MASNEHDVDVYVGTDNPYIFTWGGFRFRIHQGDPPDDHARVEPPGPPIPEVPTRPRVTIWPDERYEWPAEPGGRGTEEVPERVGVVGDLDAVRYQIDDRLAGAPVRIHVDAGVHTGNWSELLPVLQSIQGIVGSETEVMLAPGRGGPVHG